MGCVYEVEVSGDRFTIPQMCACCMGPAEDIQVLTHTRTETTGVVYQTVRTEQTAFGFPICGVCLKHQNIHENKELMWVGLSTVASVLAFFVLADVIALASVQIIPLLLIGIMVTLVFTAGFGAAIRLGLLGDTHACYGKPVRIHDATLGGMTCRFHNGTYAMLFAAANNATVQGRETRGQARDRNLLRSPHALHATIAALALALVGQFVVYFIRYDVDGRFTSQRVLAEIALRHSEWHFRDYALRRLTDLELLEELVERGTTVDASKAFKEKLDGLRKPG